MTKLFLSNQDCIDSTLKSYPLDEEIHLYLESGVYQEKLILKHHNLKIYGSKTGITRIVNADYSYKMHQDGLLYNTFRTSTVMCLGKHIELYDLEIENTSGSGFTIGQAVALSIYSTEAYVKRCKLMGHQDTLFSGPLPVDLCERYDHFLPIEQRSSAQSHQHFSECTIIGDVDFIFGSGTAYFESCTIIAKSKGYIAAPSTDPSFPYGFVFDHCKFISLSNQSDVYLARPWRKGGASIFLNSSFEGLFHLNRFEAWNQDFMRFYEYPYVHSKLSLPLKEEETERLKQYLSLHFSRSVIE